MFKNCDGPVQFSMQELCKFQASNFSRKPVQVLCEFYEVFNIYFWIFSRMQKKLKFYVGPAQVLVQI